MIVLTLGNPNNMVNIMSISKLEEWFKENKDHKYHHHIEGVYYYIIALRNSLHKHDEDSYLSDFFDASPGMVKELLLIRMEEDKGSTYALRFSSEKEAWIEFAKPKFKDQMLVDEYGHIMCHHDFKIWAEIKRELLHVNKIINEWNWL